MMGQFFTPAAIADFMSSLFETQRREVHLLDAGAGCGILTAAYASRCCSLPDPPRTIRVVAYEEEPSLADCLEVSLSLCQEICLKSHIRFEATVIRADFVRAAVMQLDDGLFSDKPQIFTTAIMNPPYRKIRTDSDTRRLLDYLGMPTTNLYAAFVWLATRMLDEKGELVAITPRSFSNGPYFRDFRRAFLANMTLRRIHVFESRKQAFRDDDVLQENVIVSAVKQNPSRQPVQISVSQGSLDTPTIREVAYDDVVHPDDPDSFIHLVTDETADDARDRVTGLTCSLDDLDLSISTGRVVDFRAKEFLRSTPTDDTLPLIYPLHFANGLVCWPKLGEKKANAIVASPDTDPLVVPSGYYVLTKRFTAKEETRRVVAAVYDPSRVQSDRVGFENHLNYFHRRGSGLSARLARGLAVFLNSSVVDRYFRQFNGHTQVNATDLRRLRYPSREQLETLGLALEGRPLTQIEIDSLVERELFANACCK